jgi:hypothetical protein
MVVSERAGSARDSAMFPEAHPGARPRARLRFWRGSSFQSSGLMAVTGQRGIQIHHLTLDVRGAVYQPVLAGSDSHFVVAVPAERVISSFLKRDAGTVFAVVSPHFPGQRSARLPSFNRKHCVREGIRAVGFRGQRKKPVKRPPRPAAPVLWQAHSIIAGAPDSCFGPRDHACVSACALSCLRPETSGREQPASLPATMRIPSWATRSARAVLGRADLPRTRRVPRGVGA